MDDRLKILVVEDNEDDFIIIRKHLRSVEGHVFDIWRATRLQEALAMMNDDAPDAVLLDLALPDSFGLQTFESLNEAYGKIPVVILTGNNDVELGLEAVKSGAQEFITKEHLSGRILVTILRHAVERQKLLLSLQDALEEVNILRGFIPICSHCKNIRDDEGFWQQIEQYISKHAGTRFSHGICPECMRIHYPDIADSREDLSE